MNTLEQRLKEIIREVPDFPKKGISFKDITPVLSNADVMSDIINFMKAVYQKSDIQAVAGIESRGFIFGTLIAQSLGVPFVPIRKAGKLPHTTAKRSYALEYGEAELEIHRDAISAGDRVLVHDDLLATGGTANAAAELIKEIGGEIAGYNFLIELTMLEGRKKLLESTDGNIYSIVKY